MDLKFKCKTLGSFCAMWKNFKLLFPLQTFFFDVIVLNEIVWYLLSPLSLDFWGLLSPKKSRTRASGGINQYKNSKNITKSKKGGSHAKRAYRVCE